MTPEPEVLATVPAEVRRAAFEDALEAVREYLRKIARDGWTYDVDEIGLLEIIDAELRIEAARLTSPAGRPN